MNCSFCGKHSSCVIRLIANNKAAICNECILVSTEAIFSELKEAETDDVKYFKEYIKKQFDNKIDAWIEKELAKIEKPQSVAGEGNNAK